jgi:hypothetical protein
VLEGEESISTQISPLPRRGAGLDARLVEGHDLIQTGERTALWESKVLIFVPKQGP